LFVFRACVKMSFWRSNSGTSSAPGNITPRLRSSASSEELNPKSPSQTTESPATGSMTKSEGKVARLSPKVANDKPPQQTAGRKKSGSIVSGSSATITPVSADKKSRSSSSSSSSSNMGSGAGILSALARTLSQTPVSSTSPTLSNKSSQQSFTSSVTALTESGAAKSEPSTLKRSGTVGASYTARIAKFERILDEPLPSIDELRKLAWKGVPPRFRPLVWKLLLGIVPLSKARRDEVLENKRAEYRSNVPTFMDAEKSEAECGTLRQISIDLPRTAPGVAPFSTDRMKTLQERVLYIWASLHPASGYVQGLNDLLTPIVLILLSEYIPVFASSHDDTNNDLIIVQECDVEHLTEEQFFNLEADAYWCLAKLLESVQDNYTNGQPGIHRSLQKLQSLVHKLDEPLEKHIIGQGVDFLQFAFRWMNCFLMRDLPMQLILRLWDTYMAEGNDGFSVFHIYVCGSFLVHWSKKIRELEMPEIMLFLQHLPTKNWCVSDLEEIIAQAYVDRSLYENSHHLTDV